MNKRVYISLADVSPGWIIGKMSEDLQYFLEKKGFQCRYGAPQDYQDEEICHHMGWAYAKPKGKADINSLFITHIDDQLKENLLISLKDQFDYFITMSREDKDFLVALGFEEHKTFGLALPTRNQYVKPLNIGMFSACYKDGRKNENWILKFVEQDPNVDCLNFVFIGPRWGNFVEQLANKNISFEWHCASQTLPFEYQFQQYKLQALDYYLYLGMDGGAMGSYDAYAYGNRLLITDNCYHKNMPFIDQPISNYSDFKAAISEIAYRQKQKLEFFKTNNIENYVDKIISIWHNTFGDRSKTQSKDVLIKRRSYYFPVTLWRLLGSVKRSLNKAFRQ